MDEHTLTEVHESQLDWKTVSSMAQEHGYFPPGTSGEVIRDRPPSAPPASGGSSAPAARNYAELGAVAAAALVAGALLASARK